MKIKLKHSKLAVECDINQLNVFMKYIMQAYNINVLVIEDESLIPELFRWQCPLEILLKKEDHYLWLKKENPKSWVKQLPPKHVFVGTPADEPKKEEVKEELKVTLEVTNSEEITEDVKKLEEHVNEEVKKISKKTKVKVKKNKEQ